MSSEHDDPQHNPYTAPSVGAEAGGTRGFAITDEVRKLIATTASLMIAAGIIQLMSGVLGLVLSGVSKASALNVVLFGIVPAFTAIAGFSLRNLGKPGDDLGSLLAGLRQLHIAFLVKGIALLLVVGVVLLSLLAMVLGVGAGFFSMWG